MYLGESVTKGVLCPWLMAPLCAFLSYEWKEHHFSGIRVINISACFGSGFCANAFQATKKHTYWLVRFSRACSPIHLLYYLHSNDDEWCTRYLNIRMDSFAWYCIRIVYRRSEPSILITHYRYWDTRCALLYLLS